MLSRVCSIIDCRGRQDVVRKSCSDTLGFRLPCHFLFLPHYDVICDLSITERAHGNVESIILIKKYKKILCKHNFTQNDRKLKNPRK